MRFKRECDGDPRRGPVHAQSKTIPEEDAGATGMLLKRWILRSLA